VGLMLILKVCVREGCGCVSVRECGVDVDTEGCV